MAKPRSLKDENRLLRRVLKNLLDASGHVSPLGGEASVKAIRRAGKYMAAFEAAQKALENTNTTQGKNK